MTRRVFSAALLPACLLLMAATCQKEGPSADHLKGLVINEIAAHDEKPDIDSWVEIVNTSESAISLEGAGLYLTDPYFNDKCVWKAAGGSLAPGERLLVSTGDDSLMAGIESTSQFILRLGTADATVDKFDRSADFPDTLTRRGTYQRIPDGTGAWRSVTWPTKGSVNGTFDLSLTKSTAIWAWSSHVSSMMENDAAMLRNLHDLGYRHILLNFAAFNYGNEKNTLPFIEKCEELGLVVHAWMQCFYSNGGWSYPIDDDRKVYKEEMFNSIVAQARSYIENFGVKGLHLDYIRFAGTASKHTYASEGVTAVGAVNRCCSDLRKLVDSYDEGIVTSAALMPEINSTDYYGQVPSQMGKYIHILMPMIYRYSYNYSDAACERVANWFADNSGGALMWSGITTYQGNDSKVYPMDAAGIRKDIDIFMATRGTGIVLFRYGLGTFPDVNDIN